MLIPKESPGGPMSPQWEATEPLKVAGSSEQRPICRLLIGVSNLF